MQSETGPCKVFDEDLCDIQVDIESPLKIEQVSKEVRGEANGARAYEDQVKGRERNDLKIRAYEPTNLSELVLGGVVSM